MKGIIIFGVWYRYESVFGMELSNLFKNSQLR
jgi:hypothetical protein